MRAVSITLKVSSTKNLVKLCHFLQAGKTLVSVVSYYLKGSGECSNKPMPRGGGKGAINSHKNRKISRTPLFLRNPPKSVKFFCSGKVSCFFKRTKCPSVGNHKMYIIFSQDSLFSFPLKLIKVSRMRVHIPQNISLDFFKSCFYLKGCYHNVQTSEKLENHVFKCSLGHRQKT